MLYLCDHSITFLQSKRKMEKSLFLGALISSSAFVAKITTYFVEYFTNDYVIV